VSPALSGDTSSIMRTETTGRDGEIGSLIKMQRLPPVGYKWTLCFQFILEIYILRRWKKCERSILQREEGGRITQRL